MPLSMLGTFTNTFSFEPTNQVQTLINPGPQNKLVVYCNRAVYLRLDQTVSDADFLFDNSETYIRVTVDPGSPISFMLADNETTGGLIKFTIAGDDW